MACHLASGRRMLLPITWAALCAVPGGYGIAQPADDGGEVAIEEIVVTGTRIKRRDFQTSSPLVTIDGEDFDFSGQATIEEALNRMPQVAPVAARAANCFFCDGTATVDLRGLGPGRSLVMLNGRRVAPTGVDNAVDLNNLPQFLIERVEIITGGTSAVYGSDALAGVVNFVTRQDYSGLGIEAGASMAAEGDAESYNLDLIYGHNFSGGVGNFTVYANVLERRPVFAGARDHTRIQYYDSLDGHLIAGGSWSTPAGVIRFPPADLGDGPVLVTFNPDGTPRAFDDLTDQYNYQPTNYLQIPLDRLAIGVMAHHDVSRDFEAYLEASLVRNEPAMQFAPAPAWTDIYVNLDNPVLTPQTRQLFTDQFRCDDDENLACFSFSNRFTALGPRSARMEQDYMRVVAGLRGEIGKNWEVDGWLSYTTGSSSFRVFNDASRSRYLQGLLVDPATHECLDPAGGCVPVNVFGEGNVSAEAANFVRLPPHENSTEQTQTVVSAYLTGPLLDTWAGSLDVAAGVDWRADETEYRADESLFSGDSLSWPASSPVSGREAVYEIYAEAVIPLASDRTWADYLGLEIGGRFSSYEHAGSVWTYKAGAQWQPNESFRLRAMHQRSTRAPNAIELFEEQFTERFWFVWDEASEDPCSATADPVGNDVVDKCLIQGLTADQIGVFEATLRYPVDFLYGGNPDLRPEVGKTLTAGAVISPISRPKWTISLDYFSLEVEDTIGYVNTFDVCFDRSNVSHAFCDKISRDETGNMAHFTELTGNRGLLETTGVDTQIQYRTELPGFASIGGLAADLSLNVYWTHLLTYKEQENLVTEVLDCAGYFGWPCDFLAITSPINRVSASIHYSAGPLGLHAFGRWIEGTTNAAPIGLSAVGFDDPVLAIPRIADAFYLDVGLDYQIGDQASLQFGVNNLFDKDPPQMADQAPSNNTDTGFYDVFGRSFYFALATQF